MTTTSTNPTVTGDRPAPHPVGGDDGGRRARRRRRWRILLGVLGAVLLLVGGAAFAGYRLVRRIPDNISHVNNVFQGMDESQRPTKPTAAANTLNFLIMGSDSRSEEPTTGSEAAAPAFVPGDQRSDVIMLVHLTADRSGAMVVSIPRDGWVPIDGVGTTKLNAAYSAGGPPLLISTVERLTGVRIDHFAIVDFAGFESVVDAVGGIDVRLAEPSVAGRYQLPAGVNHLNGTKALAYVRERHALLEGEFDRNRRQQNLIRAILSKVAAMNPVQSPVTTYRLLDAATKSITVDNTLTEDKMRALAMSLLKLRPANVAFLNAPVTGVTEEPTPQGKLVAVHLDEARCAELWTAIREGTTPAYVAAHRADLLPDAPR